MVDSLVIDPPSQQDADKPAPTDEIVSWIMQRAPNWRKLRDGAYKDRWDDYYATWRGKWRPQTKTKKTERSRLIAPASQMAVDLTVAEIVEALFGREQFFDVPDNLEDEEKEDAIRARDLLLEDLYASGIVKTLIEVVLNGALYGTGIAKINIDTTIKKKAKVINKTSQAGTSQPELIATEEEVVEISVSPVEPGQLVVDPSASDIDDMLGTAHEFRTPLHKIWKRQREGAYSDKAVVGESMLEHSTEERKEENHGSKDAPYAFITEWHGLVPTKLLMAARLGESDDLASAISFGVHPRDMTEAVVTIANESVLLRAMPNPSVMDDRALVAYQHDTVPNRFWGRGVMEKAFHPQKALDAEMRSRIDSLAWINNPMLAGDLTKLPPRMNLNVWPGKFFGTRGAPAEALQEFRFGDVNASTFQQTNDLERMVGDATGSRDPATVGQGVRDQSAGASAIAVSGMIKRSKRTMYNIEGFLNKLIRRILWRKMQFEPDRYPADFDFKVKGTIGIMAREIEQQQMVNLLQYTERGTPPYLLILKSIFESSASPAKGEMVKSINSMLQPPSEEDQEKAQQAEQLQMQQAVEQLRNIRADTALKLANGDKSKAEALLKQIEADFKDDEQLIANMRALSDQEKVINQREQNDISREGLEIQRQSLKERSSN